MSTTVHGSLAMVSEEFGPAIFSSLDFHRKAVAALDATDRWERRRRALGALLRLTVFVFLPIYRTLSIPNVLRKVFNLLREIDPTLPPTPVTPEAFCHGRRRLGVEPLAALFKAFADEVNPSPSLLGLRTWSCDGVKFTLPDTPANEKAFGRPGSSRGKSGFPQMLAVTLVDTQSHQVRAFAMGKCTDSERVLARQFIPQLGSKDLVMTDRGLSAIGQFGAFMAQGVHVLGRISKSWRPNKVRQLADGSWIVRLEGRDTTGIYIPRRRWRRGKLEFPKKVEIGKPRTPPVYVSLELRMIEYQVGGKEKCRLLTDLLDPTKYPAKELALGYHRRWDGELVYDEMKIHLASVTRGKAQTTFRSKTPEGIQQEAYGTFIAFNLVRRLMLQAAKSHQVSPLEISFVDTVEILKDAAPRFERAHPRMRALLFKQLLEEIALTRNPRPRRPRWNPREVKCKIGDFRIKRRRGRGIVIDFAAHLSVAPPPRKRRRQR